MGIREKTILAAGNLLMKDFSSRAASFGAGPMEPLRRFNELLALARSGLPAYDAACSAAGLGPQGAACLADIKKVPVLTRAAMAAGENRLSGHRALARLESGGTGRSGRLETALSLDAVAGRYAALLSVLGTTGWRMGGATAALHPAEYGYFQNFGKMLRAGAFPKMAFEFFQQYLLYRAFHNRVNVYYGGEIFSSDEAARRMLRAAQARDPELLITRPDALMALLRVADGGRPFGRLKAVLTVGTALAGTVREEAARKLGAEVFNMYASTELGYIALGGAACGGWLHVDEAGYLVENEPGRGLLVTDFNNRLTPMLRYETGDCAEISGGACACGRQGLRLKLRGRMRAGLKDRAGAELRETDIIDRTAGAGLPFFQLLAGKDGLELLLGRSRAGKETETARAVEAALGLDAGAIGRPRASGFSLPPSGKFCFLP